MNEQEFSGTWLSDGVSKIEQIAASMPRVLELGEVLRPDGRYMEKLVVGPDHCEVHQFPVGEPVRNHKFATLEGFVAYLNSKHCNGVMRMDMEHDEGAEVRRRGVVMVGQSVVADLAYQENTPEQRASLVLEPTPAYRALKALSKGVSPKDAWRLLNTLLRENFDSALLMQVAALRVLTSRNQVTDIAPSGLGKGNVHASATITVGGQNETFRTDWEWMGALWQCFDGEVPVHTVIEVEETDKGGVRLTWHLLNEEEAVLATRAALAAKLAEEVNEHFDVFEGSL